MSAPGWSLRARLLALLAITLIPLLTLALAWMAQEGTLLPTSLVLLIAGTPACLLAHSAGRPLSRLAAAVRRIEAGERNVPLPLDAPEEAGEVARAFERVLSALASREAALSALQQELAALLQAGGIIASSLDLDHVLQSIVEQAAAISGAPVVRLFLLEEGAKILRCHAHTGLPAPVEQGLIVAVGDSFSGHVVLSGEPLNVPDCRGDPRVRYPDHIMVHHLISYLGLPIRYRERGLGVLVFHTTAPRTYTDDEVTFLSAFARQAAVAIHHSELFEREQTRRRQLEAIRAVSAEITRELELDRLLQLIQQRSTELLGADAGVVYLWDEAGVLRPRAWIGFGDWIADIRLRPGEGVAGTAAQRGTGILVNAYAGSPLALPAILRTQATAALAEPLVYRDTTLGAIVINHRREGGRFSEEDQQLLRLLADQSAIAIVNARLHADVFQRAEQLGTLTRVTQTLMVSLEEKELGQAIMAAVQALVPGAGARLWNRTGDDGASLQLIASLGLDEPRGGTVRFRQGEGLAGAAAVSRQPVFSHDLQSDPRFINKAWATEEGLVSAGLFPLIARDELHGILAVFTREPHQFSPSEVTVLQSLAAHAASAMENARLFAELNRSYTDLQLAQDELIRSEKLRALGQMSAGIAHDLNNMLAAILGQTQLLQLRVTDPALRESLAMVETAAQDGAHVVRRLQDFARQRAAGRLVPQDLATLVQEALEITRPRWRDQPEQQGQTIQVETAVTGLPAILGHASEIREALINLIFNALDAMPDGGTLRFTGRVVDVSSGQLGGETTGSSDSAHRRPARPAGWVELDVADTGVGMSEEVQRRAFDPFFTTKGVRGSGLGLSLVYGIMERHGGAVTLASRPGQGSALTVRFQVAPPAGPAAPAPPPAIAPMPQRILLVDDDPAVRETVAALLRAVGHTVLEAPGGAEALAALEEVSVDLVLTDLGMPGTTGWDVARAAKRAQPERPVMLLTGWGDQVGAHAAERGLVDRILAKPCTLDDLQAAITALQRDRGT